MARKKELIIEQRVLDFIRRHGLVPGGQKLLVAVSGGPDSVCLLHILLKLRDELDIRLHVAHLDHQLRGAESKADARYVASLCRRLSIPATIEARDVTAYQAEHRLSPEEAAREVRYNFLAEVARGVGAGRVAVGHTTDDHVETILMHLVRGSGTRGLRGLQPVTAWPLPAGNLTVIRPLLPVSREETAEYCRRHRLAPRLDASNLSLAPLRNKIRLELLPLLKSYNPGIVEALLRTGRIATEDIAFLDAETARLWGKVAQQQANSIILEKPAFLKLAPALQRHLLRAAIERLLGNLKDVEARHIEEVMAALTKTAGRRLSLPWGLTFSIEYDRYLIGADPAELSPFTRLEGVFNLKVPGETRLPGWLVEAAVEEKGKSKPEKTDDAFTACFDFDKIGDKLKVRARRAGDWFQPLGMSQPKKVGEFMLDAKIPQAWRANIPIVYSPGQILWVVGWRIDERVKVTDSTGKALRLRMKRREDEQSGEDGENR